MADSEHRRRRPPSTEAVVSAGSPAAVAAQIAVSPTRLIAPMLATLGDLPAGPGWGFEFKWDGVRAITYLDADGVRVVSRNHRDVTASYSELSELGLLLAGRDVVVDGEIVALDPAGRPSFAQLQRRMHVVAPTGSLLAAVPVAYYVFDLLRLDGRSTLELPYRQRRELLDGLPLDGAAILRPTHFVGVPGAEVMTAARQRGLEGVVAKRLTSGYRPGRRSPDWIKTPINHTQEVVVIGYKPGQGRRAGTIGSLVLAVHDPAGQLVFAGGVGTGFTQAMLTQLQHQLAPWRRPTAPVAGIPREHARGVQWVEPLYVGEVAYRSWTPEGHLRHPSWRGLRPDRSPDEARRSDVTAPAGAEPEVVDGTMATADGRWHVDAVHRGPVSWYRLRHDDNTIDGLTVTEVETVLGKAGIDLGDLREMPDPSTRPSNITA
jgi:bifunctional non-homologous end joining protein LigD